MGFELRWFQQGLGCGGFADCDRGKFWFICKTLHIELEKGCFAGILESDVKVVGLGLKLLNWAGNEGEKEKK